MFTQKIYSFISLLLFVSFGMITMANNTNDSLIDLIHKSHELDRKVELMYFLSNENKTVNTDTSIIIVENALELSHNSENGLIKAKLYNLLGELYISTNEVKLAMDSYKEAILLLNDFEDNTELLAAYRGLGNIYIQIDNLPLAMETYNKAIALAEKVEDNVILPRLYNNLGIINLYIGNNDKALDLYSKALELFKVLGDTINIAGTTTNIGSIYIQLGNYEIAKSYYLQGFDLFNSINLDEGEAHVLLKLGLLEIERNDYKQALLYLNQSLTIQNEIGITYSGIKSIFMSETLINIGIAHISLDQYEEAINNLSEGIEIAEDGGDIGLISMAAKYISEYYKHKEDFQNAYEYYIVFNEYSDSISNESSVRKLTQLETQLEYDEKIFEKELENQKLVQQQQRTTLYTLLFVAILVLGLALLFVLLNLEKNKKKKAELARLNLEEKLEHTNKELATYVMYLLRKNEFIISISEKLKQAKIEAKVENKQRIAELITELENNSKMFSWEEFEVRFQQVYTSFYKTLNEKYPNLSQNEIRLCAFSKLNMTTKEIAAITYQSINSITVARYRLRKKLGISTDENLHSFFAEF